MATNGMEFSPSDEAHVMQFDAFNQNAENPKDVRTSKHHRGWRKIVRNFTPAWFSVNMGTGVVSLLLYSLPYPAPWLYYLSIAVFCLNILLFATFLLLSLLRYTLYPSLWLAMVRHPAQSLFLGTFSMGFATILNMLVLVCVPLWGPWALTLVWALWWADALVALAVCATMPFIIMQVHRPELRSMSAAWLLPIVTTVVAAASGALVAEALGADKPQHALWTLAVSYVLWGTGVSLAMSVLVIYFHRLALYRIPPREVIVSVFLPLGPLGQGGYGAMLLGKVARAVFPLTGTLSAGETRAGDVLYVVGWVVAMVMWGYGLLWLFFAVASISRSRFPFNMGWWGFTFPLGVYGLCTIQLGREMPSMFFDVLGTIIAVSVILLWIMVASITIKKAVSGEIFVAPCLSSIDRDHDHDQGQEQSQAGEKDERAQV